MELQSEEHHKVAIIDADSIIFITHWNKEDKNYDKDYEQIISDTNSFISNLLIETKATHYLGFFGYGRNFRHNINPEYKANRKGEKPKYLNQIKTYIKNYWDFEIVYDIEADDAVNICKNSIDNSFICAKDKDLLALKGTHYNYSTKQWIIVSEKDANYLFWHDMIAGQPGDNIKGIPQLGTKFVENYFQQNLEKPLETLVFQQYINHFGEQNGIEWFYKNYKCLKILDTHDSFVIKEPNSVKGDKLIL